MSPSSRCGTFRGAGATFLQALAGSAGVVLGLVLPLAGITAVSWLVDEVEERRRGRPVAIEVRADDADGWHLAFLKPGESSRFPPGLLDDLRKAKTGSVKRRADAG